jgi:hypothetical protein
MPDNGWSSDRELLPVTITGWPPEYAAMRYFWRLQELTA